MDLTEMKQIWDSQTNAPLFVINEQALQTRIATLKRRSDHITNFSEWLVIGVNLVAGLIVLALAVFKPGGHWSLFLMAAWMLMSSGYVLWSRFHRREAENRFDRSLMGALKQAVSTARYQVHLSRLMRWNMLPIGLLILLGFWGKDKWGWLAMLTVVFFVVVYYASGWEHRLYQARAMQLQQLLSTLEKEEKCVD